MQRLSAKSKTVSVGGVALVAGVASLAAFSATPAGSATNSGLTIDTPCVRDDGSKVAFRLAGFAPDATVELTRDITPLAGVTVGPDGSYTGSFGEGSNGTESIYTEHTISATDNLGSTGSAKYATVTLGAVSTPAALKIADKPAAKVSYYVQGFVEGGTLYAHYAFSKSDTVKKHLKTVALGPLAGPCGTLTTKKLTQLPVKKAKKGVYEIQFDTRKDFQRQVAPYVATTVFVAKNQKK